jgi:hypothetical protein
VDYFFWAVFIFNRELTDPISTQPGLQALNQFMHGLL